MTSKRQSTVALSTSEAEYIALFTASKEGVWLRQLFSDFGVGQTNIKHMDIKYHYVREMVERQAVVTVYSPTDIMLADILTKPLAGQRFEFSRSGLGVVCSLRDRMKCGEFELSHNYVFWVVYGDADRLAFQQTYSFLPARVMNIIFI